jgi:hypothetical protein
VNSPVGHACWRPDLSALLVFMVAGTTLCAPSPTNAQGVDDEHATEPRKQAPTCRDPWANRGPWDDYWNGMYEYSKISWGRSQDGRLVAFQCPGQGMPCREVLPPCTRKSEKEGELGTGIGETVAGGILVGLAVLDLAEACLCKVDAVIPDRKEQNPCLYATLIAGGLFSAVGVPLLVVGLRKRADYRRWEQSHPAAGAMLRGLRVSGGHQGVGLSLSAAFW